MHGGLHVDRKPDAALRRVLASDRRVDEHHHAVTGEADQGRLVAGRHGADGLIIFPQHGENDVRLGARGKRGEAAQVAENRDHLAPLSVQQSLIGVLDQFSHLRCKELLQAIDALGLLLRSRKFLRHLVEPDRQLLQFVVALDRDAMVELSHPDPFDAILQLPDRPPHAARPPIGEDKRENDSEADEYQGTPQRGADGFERLDDRLLRDHRPTHVGGTYRERNDGLAVLAGRGDRRSIRSTDDGLEAVEILCSGAAAQHKADVRVGDQTPGIVNDKRMSGVADLDRRDDIPDQFEVDVGNDDAGGRAVSATAIRM